MQYLLGHSTAAMVRRYSATYDAAKGAEVHVAQGASCDGMNLLTNDDGEAGVVNMSFGATEPPVGRETGGSLRIVAYGTATLLWGTKTSSGL